MCAQCECKRTLLQKCDKNIIKSWQRYIPKIGVEQIGVFSYFRETLMQMYHSISNNLEGSALMIFYQEHPVEIMQIGK